MNAVDSESSCAQRDAYTGLPKQGTKSAAPDHLGRDADGRVVEVRWRLRSQARKPLAGQWLLAYDGSAHALRAAHELAAMAGSGMDASLAILYVHPWRSKEAAEVVLARDGWELTAAAREALDRHALPLSVHVAMGEPAEVVLAVASREGCSGIVMGSHGRTAMQALVLGSVTQHVLSATRIPVLVTP